VLARDVVDRTFGNWIYPGGIQRPAYDTLAVALDSSSDTLELSGRANNVPRDSALEVEWEQILVSAVVANTVTAQERGYLETDAAQHASGTIVQIDPTFTKKAVLNALAAIVGMLYPAGCYWRNVDTTTTFSQQNPLHDLPAGGKRLISVLAQKGTTGSGYRRLRAGIDYLEFQEFTPPKYELLRGGYEQGPMVVVYAKDFTIPSSPDDELDDLGIPATLQPHLPMGITGYLLQGRELPRIQIEEIRRFLSSQGIQVGASLNVGQALLNGFMARHVGAERDRLIDQDPAGFEFVRS
jgi:hypothetical protein